MMANRNLSYALPTLPFDLISEILSRLSVKLLLQFRCVCKLWNSLISDHKFARKHFKLSTTHNLHVTSCDYSLDRFVLKSYSLQTLFIDTTTNFTQLECPFKCIHQHNNVYYIVGSCHGILCLSDYLGRSVKLWNPSIRKFKELPLFENSHHELDVELRYGFGYDYVSHNYKVVALYNSFHIDNTKAKIHTLGTDSWRSIQMLPYLVYFSDDDQLGSGRYVSDTINWLAYTSLKIPPFIISFDMDKESCQKILLPKHVETNVIVPQLYVLKDCLCIITYNDLWIMKDGLNCSKFIPCHLTMISLA